MERVYEIISTLEETSRHPEEAVIREMKDTGKKVVGCFPIYTPEEIIYAAGLLPVGLWGGQTEIKLADKYLQSFCCSIMRENMEQGMNGTYNFLDAIIIPIYCDTLKCICENWKVAVPNTYLIPIVYPQNRKTKEGIEYLVSQFEKLKSELEKISGKEITKKDLNESIQIYEEYRRIMQQFTDMVKRYPVTLNAKRRHLIIKAAYFMDKIRYNHLIKELMTELKHQPEEDQNEIGVVITGIIAEPEAILDVLVQNKMFIVADDLAQESRQFRLCVSLGETPLEKLAYRMTEQSCSLLYDDKKTRGQLLIDLVRENNAKGVIVSMMKFCDPEEFDYPIYKKELEEAEIPTLYLEIEQKMDSIEQIRTRIQSFAEITTENLENNA
jgi:bcr-type benzoyl-CoA reductase subunit C